MKILTVYSYNSAVSQLHCWSEEHSLERFHSTHICTASRTEMSENNVERSPQQYPLRATLTFLIQPTILIWTATGFFSTEIYRSCSSWLLPEAEEMGIIDILRVFWGFLRRNRSWKTTDRNLKRGLYELIDPPRAIKRNYNTLDTPANWTWNIVVILFHSGTYLNVRS